MAQVRPAWRGSGTAVKRPRLLAGLTCRGSHSRSWTHKQRRGVDHCGDAQQSDCGGLGGEQEARASALAADAASCPPDHHACLTRPPPAPAAHC